MSFEFLRSFLAVAEHRSFFSAATSLGVSRTTLRRHVEALEALAGVELLRRSHKGVELTNAGHRLVGGGHEMEKDFGALLAVVGAEGRRPEGEVRVLAQGGLPPPALLVAYRGFRTKWKGLRICTRFADEPLKQNLTDVDVLAWFGSGAPGPTWLISTIMTVPVGLFASASYLAEHGRPATLAELRRHELVGWIGPGETVPRMVTTAGGTVPIDPVMTSTNVDLLHEVARQGHGIVWMPDAGLLPMPGQEPIEPVLENLVGTSMPFRIAAPKALASIPKFRVVLEALETTLDLATTLPEAEARSAGSTTSP